MLSKLRALSDKIFIKICFCVIAFSFIAFSVGNFMQEKNYIASIDGKHYIYLKDFAKTKELVKKDIGQKNIDNKTLNSLILNNLIQDKLIQLESEDLGILISDEVVAKQIASNTAFYRSGKFDRDLFQSTLLASGISEKTLVDGLKAQLTTKALGHFLPKVEISEELAKGFYNYSTETRTVSLYTLAKAGTSISVSAEEITKYYEENKESFKTPEFRDIEYVVVKKAAVEKSFVISAQDLKAEIQKLDTGAKELSYNEMKEMVLKSKKESYFYDVLKDVERDLAAGDSLKEISKKSQLEYKVITKASKVNIGNQLKLKDSASFVSEAFQLDANIASDPIEIEGGVFLVLNVQKIYKSDYRDLKDVRGEIQAAIRALKQDSKEQEKISKVYSEVSSGTVTKQRVEYKVKNLTLLRSKKYNNAYITAWDLAKIFELKSNDTSHIFKTKDSKYGFAVVEKINKDVLKDHSVAHLKSVKDQLSNTMSELVSQEFLSHIYSKHNIKIVEQYLDL